MTVYIVQRPMFHCKTTGQMRAKFDLTPAEVFGEIKELLSPNAKPFTPGPIISELYTNLEKFNDSDYIICIGNPILIAVAAAIAADVNEGRMKLLQWNQTHEKYIPVDINLGFTSASR